MIPKCFLFLFVLVSFSVEITGFIVNAGDGKHGFTARRSIDISYGSSLSRNIPAISLSPTILFSSPAVLEPPTKEKEKVEDKEETTKKENSYKKGGWAVRLFNDPMNKREFVAMCLSKIVGLSDGQAYQVMMQAHKNGVSVVGRFDFERAETYKTALVENGLTCDMIEVED